MKLRKLFLATTTMVFLDSPVCHATEPAAPSEKIIDFNKEPDTILNAWINDLPAKEEKLRNELSKPANEQNEDVFNALKIEIIKRLNDIITRTNNRIAELKSSTYQGTLDKQHREGEVRDMKERVEKLQDYLLAFNALNLSSETGARKTGASRTKAQRK